MLFSEMDEADVPKTEPPDFLTRYLSANIGIPKDLTIHFPDGSIQVDKIVLCALSRDRGVFEGPDQVIVESDLGTGEHVKNMIYRGQTFFSIYHDSISH